MNQESSGVSSDLNILSDDNMAMFMRQVDVPAILRDLWTCFSFPRTAELHHEVLPGCRLEPKNIHGITIESSSRERNLHHASSYLQGSSVERKRKNMSTGDGFLGYASRFTQNSSHAQPGDLNSAPKKIKNQSREEIQRQALQKGASGG